LPDYLRLALVRDLPRPDHGRIAGFYQQLLAAADRQGPGAIALELGPPPERRFGRKLRAWFRRDTGLYGDRIFAKMLLGGRPGWLDVELPRLLAKLLPGKAWEGASARLFAGFLAAELAGGLLWGGLNTQSANLESHLRQAEIARHGSVKLAVVVPAGAEWLERPLLAALARSGFRASLGREAGQSPDLSSQEAALLQVMEDEEKGRGRSGKLGKGAMYRRLEQELAALRQKQQDG
jgi:hypothetical protein